MPFGYKPGNQETKSNCVDELANLLAEANGDKAYTHLKELVDEIREAGKYVFRNDKNKRIILQISPAFILNITLDLQMNSDYSIWIWIIYFSFLLWICVNIFNFIHWIYEINYKFEVRLNRNFMFERNAIYNLKAWAKKPNRKPLIIRGARQVGKTSLINEFGKEFDLYISLNLDRKADLDFFSKETPVNQIFESILITRRLQKPRGKVLFFIDEIQNSSFAIKALRYFYEDMPELYLIAAGSLLESLMQKQVSFPVGRVEYLALRPCTFSEFLGAMGEIPLKEKLTSVSVTELLHNRLMELFKQYTLIGGMPEVVNHFIHEKDLVALDSIYQTLLTGYRDDVEKYAPRPAINEILRYVIKYGWEFAAQRITFEKFAHSNYKSRDMAETLRTLEKALLLELVYPTTDIKLPARKDLKKKPKLLWLDTGLVNYAASLQNELYKTDNISDAWRGLIAEHITGQEIIGASTRFLEERHFWVREARNSQAELDFLFISANHGIVPIEVKSGDSSRLKSLQLFMQKSPSEIAIRFWGNYESRNHIKITSGKTFTLLNLPYYYSGFIDKYLDEKL